MKRTILVVDDSRTDRAVLSGFLRDEYELLEARHGREAIACLNDRYRVISAVVMDVVMPEMDGFEALRIIKSNQLWQTIPVIITTGMDDEESREKAVTCGADNYVIKPFNRQLLLHVIRNAVRLRETAAIANTLWRDSLTGLLNRESFFAEAAQRIRSHPPGHYVLASFDVERFQVVNDQYGSEVGDEVLRYIARTLSEDAHKAQGLTCRYMADKFAVLYPAALRDTAAVRETHAKVTQPACLSRPIRIRIGRYVVTDTALEMQAMYDRAAMAEASIKGRYDTYIAEYTESMREEILQEQRVVNDMEAALRNGEFEPWLQPQYNHATGALIGAEALVRWRKDGRIVPPDSFIPIFEKNGFIYEVDQAVWRQVCVCLRRWLDQGLTPLPISVNISRYDLFQEGFLEVVTALVREYRLPTELLRLEITESAFAESTKSLVRVVGELIERGFTVEIDDFGSGYSSLNTLKDVPASILKLDMRFFETTKYTQRGGNIVESVVRMAKWLGMAVIAEGVEEQAQADYLKSIGCYYIQGYFYAKPMPVAEYEVLLASGVKESKLGILQTLSTLDNNQFWDPKSMDTLIFNSYAGGACILEYSQHWVEMLRATDYFVRMLDSETMTIQDALGLDWRSHLDNQGIEQFSDTVAESHKTREVVYAEFVFYDLPGCLQKTIMRVGLRVIAAVGERYLIYCQAENLTAQRLAEQRQREAEQRRLESAQQLEIIMRNINGSVSALLMDDVGNTTLIFGNDKYYEIFGYTRQQAEEIHLDTMSCILPEDFANVVAARNRLKQDGVPVTVDYRAQKRDGSLVCIRANSSRMSMAGYGDQVIVSVETDITEKLSLEAQLKAIVGNIDGGVSATCLRDGTPEYIIVNDKYYELYGYTREQFRSEVASIFDRIHPDDRPRVEKLVWDAARDQKAYTMEYRILRRGGAVRHVLCSTSVIHLFGVEEPVQLSVSSDITVLRETQQKERELSLQLQTILRSLPGGVTIAVLRDQTHITLRFASDGFYGMHGYTREQLQAEDADPVQWILPEDRNAVLEIVNRIARERGSATYEYRCRKRDGDVVWLQTSNTAISQDDAGGVVLLAVSTDITELRRAQQQRQETADCLRAVLDTMGDGVTAVAFSGSRMRLLFANRRFYGLHGVRPEACVWEEPDSLLRPVHPEDRQRLADAIRRSAETEGGAQAEYRILQDGGAVRWIRAVISVTRLAGVEDPVQVIGYVDITEEKDAVERLRALSGAVHELLAARDGGEAAGGALDQLLPYLGENRLPAGEHGDGRSRTDSDRSPGWVETPGLRLAEERLRITQEEFRIAVRQSGRVIGRYDIHRHAMTVSPAVSARFGLPERVPDVPHGWIKLGKISPDTAEAYAAFFEGLRQGDGERTVNVRMLLERGWRWISVQGTTIFDDSGTPFSAIVTYADVTGRKEKEAADSRRQNALAQRPAESYTLLRCNLSKGASVDSRTGALLPDDPESAQTGLDGYVDAYLRRAVYAEDRERCRAFLRADTMLAEYYRGHRVDSLEYRECSPDGTLRWLLLTVELVEYADSNHVEAQLLFEDIDERKRAELRTIEQAETDPLTGVLNRDTFAARVNRAISTVRPGARHALLLLDLDGFRQVNDVFGHGAGDQTLTDLADQLMRSCRRSDLVGRLAGDEFLVFLPDIAGDSAVAAKARQICELSRRDFGMDVRISGSVGVALCPQDGEAFDSLYQAADEALCRVKRTGSDHYAMRSQELPREGETRPEAGMSNLARRDRKARRMLLVDDSPMDLALLSGLFQEEFRIEKAMSGSAALTKLRHYGSAITVVLLDMMLPDMSGREVLRQAQADANTRDIPVIVVSGKDDRETILEMIRSGATDYVTKPVDSDILRIRVDSAVSKAENQRLRAQNSYLTLRSGEASSYRTALERTGILVVTLNWIKSEFTYSAAFTDQVLGSYDGRSFWRVLLSDMVTDARTVQAMQQLVHDVAEDRERTEGQMLTRLKTKRGLGKLYTMKIYKEINEYGLASTLVMTFQEAGAKSDA